MNSACPSFHYRPDWSVSKRQEGAGHGRTVAQVSWARGGMSCQLNWTYLLPIHSPRLAHVCCTNLGSGSLYETDSAGAASFCMPLFSMTKAGMNIQQNCFCALSPPSMQLLMYLPEEKKKSRLLNTTQNCIPNGGKFVSNIWQGNEHDLAKNSAHSSSASMKVPHKYSQNLYYLLKACIIMALKTSCASRSLITFLLVYREQDNHHQMPSTIRYLMPQN